MADATRAGAAALPASALPVRPGEEDWTEAELSEVRAELETEITELRASIAKAELAIAERIGDAVADAGDDQADAGAKTFEREQEMSIAANRLDLLTQIRHAVERIDAGTYGYCESCGKPIPKARLKAFPMATLDVACKQREERR